jgi:hypothetical protein
MKKTLQYRKRQYRIEMARAHVKKTSAFARNSPREIPCTPALIVLFCFCCAIASLRDRADGAFHAMQKRDPAERAFTG